ncbi:MAG: ribulose-phosphate 3-epimerase, partial [Atopobium sp.]|uniref:ribulose-phosphate 3-epimerase n=1 Tax=Atopobium sp. TaxID=1872650 RepID=UPI002A74F676
MQHEVLIAPSILSADFMRLGDELDRIATADYIHFDVMDGNFVPNLSFGIPVLKQVKAHCDVPVDVHLMISNPDEMVDTYLDAGADMLCFHIEAAQHAHRIISRIHERGARAGVALNPGTSVTLLDSLLHEVDMILIMSVNPGYGGQ